MPRYAYRCNACGIEFLTMHSPDDVLEECKECQSSGTLTKLLTRPSYGKKAAVHKIGQATEDFIKEARQDLKKQQKELDKRR